jgi:uncharacterized membrane protein
MTGRDTTSDAARDGALHHLELGIARLLNIGALASVLLLAIGVALMLAAGRSPLDAALLPFDLSRIPADLIALRPEGFLELGLLVVLATPASRVIASLIGFTATRERDLAAISLGVLIIIAAGVVLSRLEV